MRLPFEEYDPQTPPERMLAAIRRDAARRRRRRRITAGSLAVAALASIGMFLFRIPPAGPPPPPGCYPVVREAWQDGQVAPYTLLQLRSGNRVIVILSKQGGKS
jgi:hypothetical protein